MVDKFGRELKRILHANGCTFVRHGKGDHEIWHSPITERNFTLDASTRKRFTANAILKQAGIKPEF
jgi:predicted RNA binding protein YcfA (HicA-like mRNA interferase family)